VPDASDRSLELAGRAGLVSQAAIWLVTGALAARLAFDGKPKPGAEPDKSGALHTLARQPFGRGLLAVLALGFASMVVWSVAEVVRKRDGKRTGHSGQRFVGAGRTAIYGVLAVSTTQLVVEHHGADSGKQEALTTRLLGSPGGRLLVGAVGIALLATAGYNIYRAVSRRFERHWDRRRMDERARRIAGPVEAIGNVGHAMVFALVGWFVSMAALHFDPTEPKSLDEALATLVREPHGKVMCLAVAAGMVAWALNALAQSRWREIPARD
jgi:hypothetical protein